MAHSPTAPDGCVLAGGRGRRFGGAKAGATLAGRSLVEHAVALLADRCAHVVVVSRPGIELPRFDVPVIFDRPGPDAPLVGLATALSSLDADEVLALACDLPFAGPLLDRLLAAPSGVAVAGVDAAGPQPLCARYPRRRALVAAEELLETGAFAARGLLSALGARLEQAHGDELLNVNDPTALARAEALLSA